MGGSGDAPAKTAEQKAMERAQREQLDKETASSERRLKAIAQKKIGKASLLGQPIEQAEAPEGPTITEGYDMSTGQLRKTPKSRGVRGTVGKLLGGKAAKKPLAKKASKKTILGGLF